MQCRHQSLQPELQTTVPRWKSQRGKTNHQSEPALQCPALAATRCRQRQTRWRRRMSDWRRPCARPTATERHSRPQLLLQPSTSETESRQLLLPLLKHVIPSPFNGRSAREPLSTLVCLVPTLFRNTTFRNMWQSFLLEGCPSFRPDKHMKASKETQSNGHSPGKLPTGSSFSSSTTVLPEKHMLNLLGSNPKPDSGCSGNPEYNFGYGHWNRCAIPLTVIIRSLKLRCRMAFVLGCHTVLISTVARAWTNHNSTAVFLIRCDGSLLLFAHHKTVVSHGQLHYGRRADGNRKVLLSIYHFRTENWGGIILSGMLTSSLAIAEGPHDHAPVRSLD